MRCWAWPRTTPSRRALVNSGRLSVPSLPRRFRLNTADDAVFAGNMVPGAPMDDAPIESVGGEPWLLQVLGDRFQVLHYVADAADLDAASVAALQSLAEGPIPVEPIVVAARGRARPDCAR
jgi:3-(3-hydroxy-phenyl)propionate hydroxylase